MTNANDFRVAAENAGAEDFYNDGSQEFSMSEDDGNFFVEQFGLRAAFSFGQECSRRQFNVLANRVLRSMGYEVNYNEVGVV